MLFGQPGVDPRIQTSFDSLEDLPWASTYHSYQPHLGFQHMHRGCASRKPSVSSGRCFARTNLLAREMLGTSNGRTPGKAVQLAGFF
ncbi:unnamed protein product [Effrenium voratum]|nr:unnamed protein product [Effrenium voratum]